MTRRIIFLANTSWYLWNFRICLAERLIADGHDVVMCAPPDKYSEKLATVGRFVPFSMDRKSRNLLRESLMIIRMWRLLRRERPDLVLTWTPKPNIYASLAGRVLRVPVLPNVAGLGFAFVGNGWLARVAGLLYRVAFARCPIVFFQNSDDKDKFLNSGWVNHRAASQLPGSGVDLQRFKPRSSQLSKDQFSFLFLGRLLADKGLRELVSATRQLRREGLCFSLKLVGFIDEGNPAGIPRNEIEGWAQQGLVEYLGATDCSEKIFEQVDCVVLPSYYREGVPRSLLEAAASGLPVITTDAPGCRDAIIDGKTGLLCVPRDVESLVESMRKMLKLPDDTRRTMGASARVFVERNFSEEIVISEYRKAIRTATMVNEA